MPQHSMQISRQSEDSQQASMMPQSMSHGQLQSSPRSSVQQQQQQASDVHAPQEACATTMLHSVRNSQNRQAKMQWTQQSGVAQTLHNKVKKKKQKRQETQAWKQTYQQPDNVCLREADVLVAVRGEIMQSRGHAGRGGRKKFKDMNPPPPPPNPRPLPF